MNKKNLLKALGPGILFASTAIGVSHLVQSTQAGEKFGFGLLWAVIIANFLKYPFFEYGSRYANATGTSIIDGYKKLGKPVLWIYFTITIVSMFMVASAVGFVTSGFMQNLFGIKSSGATTLLLFFVCGGILISGKFSVLDKLIKIIGIVLLISTLIAFVMTIINGPMGSKPLFEGNIFPESGDGILFLLGLMGWMPTALDLSTWNSLWTIERIKQTGYKPTMKETLFDFNFGYLVSALLSLCFITMGAYLLYGTSETIPNDPAGFANGIVNLYTKTMGNWSYILIAAAAFSIMFGTCIAVFDGYGRAIQRTTELIFNPKKSTSRKQNTKMYATTILIIVFGSFSIIELVKTTDFGIKGLVNMATTLSFIIAPIIAVFNVILVQKKHVGEHTPPIWIKITSYLGIVFLTVFSIYFLVHKLGG
ncbi:Nramp family divalent metal transporter [Flavobacteriales bacterium]|nr:Nramp family divalent metal transporter [Flavobacteriales bacterium]